MLIRFLFTLVLAVVVPTTTAYAAPVCGGVIDGDNVLLVRRTEARCPWPFQQADLALVCVKARVAPMGELNAVYVIRGKAYPINGDAKMLGAPPPFALGNITEIAANDTVTMPWIKAGRELCSAGGSRL